MSVDAIEVLAPAKVNLLLAVLGKRPDGYHNLVSVMQKLDLVDRLLLSREGRGISMSCLPQNVPEDHSNLAWRAARLFFDQTGVADDLRITLRKSIPVAAGLGGGSSDAAAVLVGLNRLCSVGLAEGALRKMAAQLGADVPFFVANLTTALATGTGTELRAIDGPGGYFLVLVKPGVAVSTRWVYENFLLTSEVNPYTLGGSFCSVENVEARLAAVFSHEPCDHGLFNDLESVTVAAHPVIKEIKEQLLADGAFAALMSGSGPTVFGLFRQRSLAEKTCERFQRRYAEVFLAAPLK